MVLAHNRLKNFKKAIDYHEHDLKIFKEIEFGDKSGEGMAYCNLGNVHYRLGNFSNALDYHHRKFKNLERSGCYCWRRTSVLQYWKRP